MKINKFISTIFLVTTIVLIYLFGIIFYLYLNTDNKTVSILKESLATTSSFFGGITTLVAAYIASKLFNDWRDQQRHQNSIEFAKIALESYKIFDRSYSGLVDNLISEFSYFESEPSYYIEEDSLEELIEQTEEILDLFYYFHDDFVNYLYVTYPIDSNDKLIIKSEIYPNIEDWEESVMKFHEMATSLTSDKRKRAHNFKILKELTTSPMDDISGDLTLAIRDTILRPLKLENVGG